MSLLHIMITYIPASHYLHRCFTLPTSLLHIIYSAASHYLHPCLMLPTSLLYVTYIPALHYLRPSRCFTYPFLFLFKETQELPPSSWPRPGPGTRPAAPLFLTPQSIYRQTFSSQDWACGLDISKLKPRLTGAHRAPGPFWVVRFQEAGG